MKRGRIQRRLRPETWCHPETHASKLKRSADREISVWPLHRNAQDVWTQLCTSQTAAESKSSIATKSRSTESFGQGKIYGCLCAGVSAYLCTATDPYLPVRLTAGVICQCLLTAMFDYVSRCVYINEIEMYVLISPCMSLHTFICVYVCILYDGGGERWHVEN